MPARCAENAAARALAPRMMTSTPRILLSARRGSVSRRRNRRVVGQRPARDFDVALIKMVAQAAEQLEAVGVDPERHHRYLRIQPVHQTAECGIFLERDYQRLAAIVGDRLDTPGAQAESVIARDRAAAEDSSGRR